MIDDEIIEIVTEHYRTPGADLLLLSHLGKRLSDDDLWPALGDKRSLYEAVDAVEGIRLIRDENTPAYIAVVPNGSEQLAQKKIADRQKRNFLRSLPRALHLAFTLPVAADKSVFVKLLPKIIFRVGESASDGELPIDMDLRVPAEGAGEVDKMSVEDVEQLDANVRVWGVRYNVDLSELNRRIRRPAPEKKQPPLPSPAASSALERLYAAQDPDVAGRMIVPIDIAVLLGRTN